MRRSFGTASAGTPPATTIVPGDIIVIEEGDTIPADGRLVESIALQTAEAALTGESLPVTKDTQAIADEVPLGDRHNMVFSGTAAIYGHGTAVVTATGMRAVHERERRWTVQGDPTEGALLVAARKCGLSSDALDKRLPRVGEVPFSSERKLMSTIHRDLEQQARGIVFTKGAPDVLLTRCSFEVLGDGRRPLSPSRREEILQVNEALAGQVGAVGISLLLQVVVIYAPWLQRAFGTVSLSGGDWLFCMAIASSVLWLRELTKALSRAHRS